MNIEMTEGRGERCKELVNETIRKTPRAGKKLDKCIQVPKNIEGLRQDADVVCLSPITWFQQQIKQWREFSEDQFQLTDLLVRQKH